MNTKRILRKTGKWIGFIFLGIIVIVALVLVYAYIQTERRFNKVYETRRVEIEISGDSASVANGEHLLAIYACRECHGPGLSGKVILDNPILGKFTSSNLTSGKGGIPLEYSNQDWLRALKYGLNKESRPLVSMPSDESTKIPDEDLADIIAYLKTLPSVDYEGDDIKIGPLMRILTAFNKVNLLAAEQIDHNKVEKIVKPEVKVSVEYGAVLAINCTACHRSDFRGGPPLIPDHPPVPDISSTGRPGKWTEEQFVLTLRTGVRPDGHKLDNNIMPWERFREFTDVEIKALRAYLLSFPRK